MLPSQADILRAAKRDQLDHHWTPLPDVEGVQVSRDAARLDGVRVPVTSATAEAIALEWGAELPTPVTHDLRHQAAATRVVPITWDYRTMQSEAAVRGFSAAIDAQLVGAFGERGPGLVSCVGKIWARTLRLEERRAAGEPNLACNYGLFIPGAPYDSVLRVGKLWQQPGYQHDAAHWDYSQTLQLVRVEGGFVQPSDDGLTGRHVDARTAPGRSLVASDPQAKTAELNTLAAALAVLGAALALFSRRS
jgi:hypothetical protein